jgi:2-methylcitrate dehydratase PrpD
MPAETIADRLGEFAVELDPANVPAELLRTAEMSTLDFFGVVLAAGTQPAAQIVVDYARAQGGPAEATLIGTPARVPVAAAVLANGTRAHAIELDDHEAHMRSKVHPGVVVMPAAWAIAESLGNVSGLDFLTAVVVGYDVIGRLSAAANYPDYLGKVKGFHTTGLFGSFAAAATAGRLLGLTGPQVSSALGICGSMCAGLQETVNAGAMMKPFHAGWSAQSGVIAAQLAARGYVGPRSVFEGKRGFYRAYCGEGEYDVSIVDARLGTEFDIAMIMYKPYACGGGIHPALTAIEQLREAHGFAAADVERVDVRTSEHARDSFATPREVKIAPPSGSTAQHSLPFAAAVLLVDGVALIDQFTNEAVRRPEVLELAARVHVEADPNLHSDDPEDEPAEVTVRLRNGQAHVLEVRNGLGSLAVPMTEQQLIDKYRLLATPVIGERAAADVEARTLDLRHEDDVSDLPAACVAVAA